MGYEVKEPTMNLRFVERQVFHDHHGIRTERRLQQQWTVMRYADNHVAITGDMEWRDIPIGSESP